MITLSVYLSDDEKRKSTVFKENNTGKYGVSMTTDKNTLFELDFINEEEAEFFAEEWILKNE
jgi:hypothetical protein